MRKKVQRSKQTNEILIEINDYSIQELIDNKGIITETF